MQWLQKRNGINGKSNSLAELEKLLEWQQVEVQKKSEMVDMDKRGKLAVIKEMAEMT